MKNYIVYQTIGHQKNGEPIGFKSISDKGAKNRAFKLFEKKINSVITLIRDGNVIGKLIGYEKRWTR